MEKETIEEFSKRIAIAFDCDNYKAIMQLIIEGAKWQAETYHQFTLSMDSLKSAREGYLKEKEVYRLKQQERMYTEEDMSLAFIAGVDKESYRGVSFYVWFEQFKKK